MCRALKLLHSAESEPTLLELSKHIVNNSEPALMERTAPDIPALLEQARLGDSEAFGILCRAFQPRLTRQAFLLCGDSSLAEDLAQETMAEAWRCLGRYNGSCQFFTWLCAIVHHRYHRFLRRERLRWFLTSRDTDSETASDLSEQYPDNQPWPNHSVELREQAVLVRRCIQALPKKQQQVIYLRFFVDDSLEGIAAALHCSLGTVKSRLFHAMEKLRRMPTLRQGAEPGAPNLDCL